MGSPILLTPDPSSSLPPPTPHPPAPALSLIPSRKDPGGDSCSGRVDMHDHVLELRLQSCLPIETFVKEDSACVCDSLTLLSRNKCTLNPELNHLCWTETFGCSKSQRICLVNFYMKVFKVVQESGSSVHTQLSDPHHCVLRWRRLVTASEKQRRFCLK